MKIALAVISIALFLSPSQAQEVSIEKDFERQKPGLSVVRFTIGEDATSGSDYLVYRRRAQIKKIRSIWNGGASNDPTVEDVYFKDGSPVLFVKQSGKKGQLNALVKGRNAPLRTDEKLYLRESKLTTWIENGKTIPSSDPRWKNREQEVLDQVKNLWETYQMYRQGQL